MHSTRAFFTAFSLFFTLSCLIIFLDYGGFLPRQFLYSVFYNIKRFVIQVDYGNNINQNPVNNELFKEEIQRLRAINSNLEVLLDLRSNFSFVGHCRIVFREANYWNSFLIINKGFGDGIKVSDIVVGRDTGKQIIGQVLEVFSKHSQVLLLTSIRSRVSVYIPERGLYGIAYGDGSSNLVVDLMDNYENVQIGDLVLSSGFGGIFPPDLFLGKVYKIDKERGLIYIHKPYLKSPYITVLRNEYKKK